MGVRSKIIRPDELVLQLPQIARYVSYASDTQTADELMNWADECEREFRKLRKDERILSTMPPSFGGFQVDVSPEMISRLSPLVQAQLTQALEWVYPHAVCEARFACFEVHPCSDGVFLEGADLIIPGRSIQEYLAGAHEAYLFVVTFPESDALIARAQQSDSALAVFVGGVCTEIIERTADVIEAAIVQDVCDRALRLGLPLYTNARYSPGYGDVPLSVHPDFVRAVQADEMGVQVLPTNFLAPSRTITAFVGVYDAPPARAKLGCAHCNCRDVCAIRKSGHTCYTRCW